MMSVKCARALTAAALSSLSYAIASGQTQTGASFYAGKVVTFVVGTGAGGGNDLYARILAQYMQRHVPGNPTFVIQNMPGADGAVSAGYIYNVAPKDGTVVALAPSSMIFSDLFKPETSKFDLRKFDWIGTISTMTDVLAVTKSSGVGTIDEAKQKEVAIGAGGQFGLSALEPQLTNALLGTKFHVIRGYSGGDSVDLAMDRNEVQGRTNQWSSWKSTRPDWIRDGRLNYLLQYGPKEPDLAQQTPSLGDLVADPSDKAVVRLLETAQYVGRAVFAPPNVPKDRLDALRKAFEDTMRDPTFVQRMTELKLDLRPESGAAVAGELNQAFATQGVALDRIRAIVGAR
jgi:tripartite-type tricarboxylate transporter receptor subunit TctC